MVMAKLVFYASMRSGSGLGLFPVTYRNDFEMTEKNLVISVRMSENIG